MDDINLASIRERLEMEDPPIPHWQTSHRPGSLEKIELMRQRLESGLHLYHPDLDGVGNGGRTLVYVHSASLDCAELVTTSIQASL